MALQQTIVPIRDIFYMSCPCFKIIRSIGATLSLSANVFWYRYFLGLTGYMLQVLGMVKQYALSPQDICKLCFFCGDVNIDLMKPESYQTKQYIDTVLGLDSIPLITLPTYITSLCYSYRPFKNFGVKFLLLEVLIILDHEPLGDVRVLY